MKCYSARLRLDKVWVVERLREPYANSFASKDNSGQLEDARG